MSSNFVDVLVIGGGVIGDIGAFAASIYHRSTPYIMLSTSVVSAIDSGPSPRSCCVLVDLKIF